jgi:hypothetical protein
MTVKSISFGAPFSWLASSFEALRRDNGLIFGATALLVVVASVPGLIYLVLHRLMQPLTPGIAFAILAVFTLISTVLFSPIIGGYFRVLHAHEQRQPVRAAAVFALLREPAAAGRMIATALIFVAIKVVLLIAVNFATGGYVVEFYKVILTTPPGHPPVFPPMQGSFLLWFVAIVFLVIPYMTAYLLAIAQAALSMRTPIDSVGDGFAVTLRNLAVFILFYLAICLAAFVFLLIFALVVGLVAVLFKLISPILAIVVLVPICLAMLLFFYAVMFNFNYYAWRGTRGDDTAVVEQQITA